MIKNIIPILSFGKNEMLVKPGKDNFYPTPNDFLDPINDINGFVKGLDSNRMFVTTDTKKNSIRQKNAKCNLFYIDYDVEVVNTIEENINIIYEKTGYRPFASWYSMSYTEENKKQKHLFIFDKNLEEKDMNDFNEVTKYLCEKIGIEFDKSANSMARICFPKHKDHKPIYNTGEYDESNYIKYDELLIKAKRKPFEKSINTDLSVNGDFDFNFLKSIGKKYSEFLEDEIGSYRVLVELRYFLHQFTQFDNDFITSEFSDYVDYAVKNSKRKVSSTTEIQVEQTLKEFNNGLRKEEKRYFEQRKALSESNGFVLKNVFDYISKKMRSTYSINTFNYVGMMNYILDVNYDVSEIETKDIRELKKRLELVKSSIEYKKDMEESEKHNDVWLTQDFLETIKQEDMKVENTPTFYGLCNPKLRFEYNKGLTVISGVSHSGKSFLALYLAANSRVKTRFFSLDQTLHQTSTFVKTLISSTDTKDTNLLNVSVNLPTDFSLICEKVEEFDVVVIDLFGDIIINDVSSEYEADGLRAQILNDLCKKYPDKCFIVLASVSKGGKNDDDISSSVKGNNSLIHKAALIYKIKDGENNGKIIVCQKDKINLSDDCIGGQSSDEFDKITTFLSELTLFN